jgi:hypothetical protein
MLPPRVAAAPVMRPMQRVRSAGITYEVRDDGLPWLKIDAGLRSLHGDPRYKALLRKMNLPQ